MIAVNGSLQTRKYQDKQGNNRTAYEIQVREVSFAARNPLTACLHGVLMNGRKVMPAKLETLTAPRRRLKTTWTILP